MTARGTGFGFLCVLVATVLWSTAEVAVRFVVNDIPPIQLAAIRFGLGALVLAAFLPMRMARRKLKYTRRMLYHAAWLSVFGVVLSSICFQYSLKYAGAGVVATVWGTNPLLVLALSAVVLGEPLTRVRVVGVVAGFAGIVILSLSKESETFTLWGLGYALGASLSFAIFTVFVKRFAGAYAGLPFTTVCTFWGALFLLPLVWAEGGPPDIAVLYKTWPILLYLGILSTGLAYLLYFMGLEHIEATQAASVLFLKPPLATALAAVLLGEPITGYLLGGISCVLAGLYLIVRTGRKRAARIAGRAQRP